MARRCSQLAWPVDVGTVLDSYHVDPAAVVVDAVDHPLVAAAGTVQALEPKLERLTHPVRIVSQGTVQELHHGSGDLLGQPGQRPAGRGCPGDRVPGLTHRRWIRRSASSLLSSGASAVAISANASRMSARSASLPITSRVSSSDSRSSTLMTTAAGWPCLVITTRPCSRSSRSTTSESRFLTSASGICSPTVIAISIATFYRADHSRPRRSASSPSVELPSNTCLIFLGVTASVGPATTTEAEADDDKRRAARPARAGLRPHPAAEQNPPSHRGLRTAPRLLTH